MTPPGGSAADDDRSRLASLWRRHRARWALPLVIIVVIGLVAVIDHLDSHAISKVDEQTTSSLVATAGGTATVDLGRPWDGFNPGTPGGASSSTAALLTSVLPSAYVVNPKLVPVVNNDLLLSVEATSTSPLTIQYVINPAAVWSDGVPVRADDFIYAWESQRGGALDVNGQPDQVASTLGYRDVASVVGSDRGRTVTVTFTTPFTDWRLLFDHMVPAHVAERVGWNRGFATFDPHADLSAGPYVVQSATAAASGDTTAVLVRNPKWWGTPAVIPRIQVEADASGTAWTGSLAVSNSAVAQPDSVALGPLAAVTALPNVQSAVKPSLDLLSLEFDVTGTITGRVAVREALAHLVDRKALLDRTVGTVEPSIVPDQDHLATASQSTYTPSSASGEYQAPDPAVADRLLRSAGYHRAPGGAYVNAAGTPLTVRLAVEEGGPWIDQVGTLLAGQLRSGGIGVTVTSEAGAADMREAALTGAYDLALVTRVMGPYQSVTGNWYSEGQGILGTLDQSDWSHLDDPQVDQLFSQAAEDLNPVDGGAIYDQIDDQLWDQMVSLPLFVEPGLLANGVQIDNVQYNPSVDGVLWNVPLWTTLQPAPAGHRS